MSTLVQQQLAFSRCLGKLLTYADLSGIEVAGGEWWRSPEEAARLHAAKLGSLDSLHTLKLATDLTCFKMVGGVWEPLTAGTAPEYKLLGQYWESLHADASWGGNWQPPTKPDYDHFSLRWQGRA